jgi:GNAT superfamily N-acetyltransferase
MTDILLHAGHDMASLFAHAPDAHVRFDDDGWLVLSGERDTADLNQGAVGRGASAALLDGYVREIRARDLSAILMVDPASEQLARHAEHLGLTAAGTVPVMLRQAAPITPMPRDFTVRPATASEVHTANELAAAAFSLDPAKVHRVFPPSTQGDGVRTWVVEDDGTLIGCGTFVRSGDCVGVYIMATPPQHQGRGAGRAVLEHGMLHYQSLGATSFTLEATAQGFHLYEQVGFRTVMEALVFVIGNSTQFPA